MEAISDYIQNGLIQELAEAKHHLKIWEKINKYSEDIRKMPEENQELFDYIKHSALHSMVLKTARIFDKHNKRNPTRCIESLFNQIKSKEIEKIVSDDSRIRESLKNLGCEDKFPDSIVGENSKVFLLKFITYCEENLLATKFKDDIKEVKEIRDKYIGHNEANVPTKSFDREIVSRLTDLVLNIATIVYSALFGDVIYLIEEDVDKQSYFIDDVIENLKENIKSTT